MRALAHEGTPIRPALRPAVPRLRVRSVRSRVAGKVARPIHGLVRPPGQRTHPTLDIDLQPVPGAPEPGPPQPWRAWLQAHAMPLGIGTTASLALASLPMARRLRKVLPPAMADQIVSSMLMGVGWVSLAMFERVAPLRADWVGSDRDTQTDRGYFTMVLVPTVVAARLGDKVLHQAAGRVLDPQRRTWSTSVPLPARVAGALLISEFVHYWHHRMAHQVPVLWNFHRAHHSSQRMYWLNGLRFHPVDEAPLLAMQTLALQLAGVDADAQLVHHVFKSINGMLQHANIAGHGGALNQVMSTAELHRIHHSSRSGPGTNYGAVLSVWDRVFGTQEAPDSDGFEGRVGLVNGDYPTDLKGQILEPFRRSPARARSN